MFSSIFGSSKKKVPSNESLNNPPIPTARPEDDYVMINPKPGVSGGLYPSFNHGGPPAPTPAVIRTAPQPPFHYLQGVPFRLSKELQMSTSKDTLAVQIGDALAITSRKINIDDYNYDFSVEKSVLREY